MSQSRRMSAVEAMTTVVIGVAVAANGLVRPLFGLAVSMGDAVDLAGSCIRSDDETVGPPC